MSGCSEGYYVGGYYRFGGLSVRGVLGELNDYNPGGGGGGGIM